MEESQKGFAFRNYLCDYCMAGIGKATSNMEMPAKALNTCSSNSPVLERRSLRDMHGRALFGREKLW